MYTDSNGKKWFKGNLHMHTKRSDGRLTPEEAIALYRKNGYDFIALTDHWKVSKTERHGDLLVLSGCEYNVGKTPSEGIFHIVGAGMYTDPCLDRADSAQEIIDRIRACGGFAVLAHPAWSLNTPEQLRSLHGYDATEIFNSVSDFPRNCRPYSGAIVDLLASEGNCVPLIATDDAHWYAETDTCRSYIWVQADENSPEALLSAMRAGRFYATQGPRISVKKEDRRLVVETTPASRITFFSDAVWVNNRSAVSENVTSCEYAIHANETFVRVEVTDAQGRTAWWSPISV